MRGGGGNRNSDSENIENVFDDDNRPRPSGGGLDGDDVT